MSFCVQSDKLNLGMGFLDVSVSIALTQSSCMQETLDELEDLKVSPKATSASSSVRKKGRKISAKCWMAQKFPMSLRQLLPVMDVIGHANKHLGRMAKFLRKYGDMELFPVKLQVGHWP